MRATLRSYVEPFVMRGMTNKEIVAACHSAGWRNKNSVVNAASAARRAHGVARSKDGQAKAIILRMLSQGATNADIITVVMAKGGYALNGVRVAISRARRVLGHVRLAPGRSFSVEPRVNDYIRDVAEEYGCTFEMLRARLLTAICDDDLARAVLGDPPKRRSATQSSDRARTAPVVEEARGGGDAPQATRRAPDARKA